MTQSPVPQAPPSGVSSDAFPIARRPALRLVAVALGCALIALVPALWLLGVQQRDLALHQQRLRGQEQLVAIAPLVGALPWHRDLSVRLLHGDRAVEGALRRAGNEVRSALRRADAILARDGNAFRLDAAWKEIDGRWAHLESRYAHLSAADNVEAHNRLLQHVNALGRQLVQRSLLTQDAAAGAHLLLLAETDDIPELAHHLAMLRAHALLAAGESEGERRTRMAGTVQQAQAALERLAAHMSAAYAADPASRALLEQRGERAMALARGVLEEAQALLASGRALEPDTSLWFSTTTQAVESLQGLYDALAERVSTLLEGELETLRVRQGATGALAALFGSCALLAALVLGRAMLRRGRARTEQPAALGERSRPPA